MSTTAPSLMVAEPLFSRIELGALPPVSVR